MIGVILREGESIESALKRFKGECLGAGIHSEIKRREFFEKPSETRKRKLNAIIRKSKRRNYLVQKSSHLKTNNNFSRVRNYNHSTTNSNSSSSSSSSSNSNSKSPAPQSS